MMTPESARAMAFNYLRAAAQFERSNSTLAAHFRKEAARAFRRQAKLLKRESS